MLGRVPDEPSSRLGAGPCDARGSRRAGRYPNGCEEASERTGRNAARDGNGIGTVVGARIGMEAGPMTGNLVINGENALRGDTESEGSANQSCLT